MLCAKKVILQRTKTSLYVLKEAFCILRIVPMVSKASDFRHAIDRRKYVQAVCFFQGSACSVSLRSCAHSFDSVRSTTSRYSCCGQKETDALRLRSTSDPSTEDWCASAGPGSVFSCALVVSMASEHQTWMDGLCFVSGPSRVVVGACHSPVDGGVLRNCSRGGGKLGSMGTTHGS